MCKWGDTVPIRVKIPADLSSTGEGKWKYAQIDRCIADLVAALQAAGIDMRGSCCGHGKAEGAIELQDGRVLLVLDPKNGARYMAADGDVRTPAWWHPPNAASHTRAHE